MSEIALRRRIDELETQVESLTQRLKVLNHEHSDDQLSAKYPFFSKLSPFEKIIMRALDSRGLNKVVTHEHIIHMLDGKTNNPDITLKVLAHRLRMKMKATQGHNLEVKTIHRIGYMLVEGELK